MLKESDSHVALKNSFRNKHHLISRNKMGSKLVTNPSSTKLAAKDHLKFVADPDSHRRQLDPFHRICQRRRPRTLMLR